MTCTFFGSRFVTEKIHDALTKEIVNLIENQGVRIFYVGHNGSFDRVVAETLYNLRSEYDFEFYVVLAYLSLTLKQKKEEEKIKKEYPTIYPEELTSVPYRYAIVKRNDWMLNKADFVITYVTDPFGNSQKFKEKAEQKGKKVVEILRRR